ncbi:MAG: hypothetical protein ACQEVA_16790 [Myxococcota bacterium]
MATNEQIEAYLIETEMPFEQVNEGLWLINDETDNIENIVVYHTEPVLTFRVKLVEAPKTGRLELFTRLLHLNAESMVAGAYGLEEDNVVIVDTLQSENMDFNEFQASLDAIAMAVREHYEEIKALINSDEDESGE